MKVAIAYPPILSDNGVPLLSQNRQFQWFNRQTFIYPVVPAYAATLAKKDGHDVFWLDGIAEMWSEDEFNKKLISTSPEIILIEAKTPIIKLYWNYINKIKKLNPSLKIVLVGDHATALPKESFENSNVDYLLTGGDYDFLFLSLLKHLKDGTPLEPGIWWRDGKDIRNSGTFKLNHELSKLPWIDRDLTHWHLYCEKNGNFRKIPGTYIMAGRDCWHGKCSFCSWTTLYPNYRTRDPIDEVDEIGHLIENYDIKEIMDDTGSFPIGEWLHTFCNEMIKRKYYCHINFDCNMRFGHLTFNDYKLMKKAGFRLVLFGLESANQYTLDRINKNLKVEQILEGAKAASRAGLDVHITVMFGYPWESPEEITNTIKLARKLLIKGYAYTLQATMVVPYPGTPLFSELDKAGLLETQNWSLFDMRQTVMKSNVTDKEVKKAIRNVYSAFLHPEAIARRLIQTKNLTEDIKFYSRGVKSLMGHLKDFL